MRAGQGRRRNHPRSVPIDAPHVSPRQCARLIRQAASARPQWQRCDLLLVFATTNGGRPLDDQWSAVAKRIEAEIHKQGAAPENDCLRQAFDGDTDVAVLLVPMLGFALQPHALAKTIAKMRGALESGGFLARYPGNDGWPTVSANPWAARRGCPMPRWLPARSTKRAPRSKSWCSVEPHHVPVVIEVIAARLALSFCRGGSGSAIRAWISPCTTVRQNLEHEAR